MAVMNMDYGPMKLHEMNAQLKGEVGGLATENKSEENPKGRVADLVLPVIVLIIFCILGMIYVGGFWGDSAGDFIAAFSNTDAYVALPWGGLVALVIAVAYLVARRVLTFKQAMECVPKGFIAMVPPITILTLAVSLKTMTNMLGADVFVYNVMQSASQGLFNLQIGRAHV